MARRGNVYGKKKPEEHVNNVSKTLENSVETKKDNKKTIILICFVIIALVFTAIMLWIKYKKVYMDNTIKQDGVEETSSYGITDYKEMYYINPLKFTEETYYVERDDGKYRTDINYIVISGLKDKKIQDSINNEIKESAYKYYNDVGSKEDYLVYTYVQGNYSNILSINITILIWDNEKEYYRIEEDIGLNYNLISGEKILLTDVFLPTTPINYIISNIAYETLAWDTEIDFGSDDLDWEQHMNMDNRDTSEYEDIILRNIIDFNKTSIKSKEFYITPSRVFVKMKIGNSENENFIGIPLYEYAEHISIYKKFIVKESKLKEIYEILPTKQKLVFTDDVGIEPYYEDHVYDNLFLSLTTLGNEEYNEEIIKNYPESVVILKDELVEKNVVDITNKVKALARENEQYGYITRALIDSYIETFDNDFYKQDYIHIYVELVIDRCDIAYYKESAFKALAARVLSPKSDVWGAVLGELDDKNITRQEKDSVSLECFYDINGKIIAKDFEELEIYMNNKYNELSKQEQNKEVHDVNIYSE